MGLWAWLHLPTATVATSVATSTKTVVVAGLLVGMTTTATAGVVMLGSSAVRMQTTQGQQPIPHLGASAQTDRTPVVVVPPIHRPVAATPEATPPVVSTGSPAAAVSTTSEAIATAALPTPDAVAAGQPTAPAAVQPAPVKAHAAATSAAPPPNATPPANATPPPHTTPPRAAATPSAAPPPVPSPAVLATSCGTITASQADRAVIAQYSCRGNTKPNNATQLANTGTGQQAGQQDEGDEPARGHVHRR